jgi:hypothetical protein
MFSRNIDVLKAMSDQTTPPLSAMERLARDIVEQVQRRYEGRSLPDRGSVTVYADAQMVLAALRDRVK